MDNSFVYVHCPDVAGLPSLAQVEFIEAPGLPFTAHQFFMCLMDHQRSLCDIFLHRCFPRYVPSAFSVGSVQISIRKHRSEVIMAFERFALLLSPGFDPASVPALSSLFACHWLCALMSPAQLSDDYI